MAFVTPDFSEAVSIDNTPITGVFNGRITGAATKTSKAGDPMISWEFTLFGAYGDSAKYNNRKIWYTTMVTGKGAGGLKTLLTIAGLPTSGFDTDHALGKEMQLTLGTRNAQDGKVYQDVKAIAPIRH